MNQFIIHNVNTSQRHSYTRGSWISRVKSTSTLFRPMPRVGGRSERGLRPEAETRDLSWWGSTSHPYFSLLLASERRRKIISFSFHPSYGAWRGSHMPLGRRQCLLESEAAIKKTSRPATPSSLLTAANLSPSAERQGGAGRSGKQSFLRSPGQRNSHLLAQPRLSVLLRPPRPS